MLLSEVRQAMLISGFDPSLGFLHQDYPGRESLALDFTEIFRAGVDNFVLKWINETELDGSSFFYRKAAGCRMSKATRPLFFNAWTGYRESWPRPGWNVKKGKNNQDGQLRELINGQVARARRYMKTLEE